jgi:hypothetical protein
MDREPKSFSNRDVIRKIIPENNVLTRSSTCSFFRAKRKTVARYDRGRAGRSLGLSWKTAGKRVSWATKISFGWLRGPKNQPELDESA